MYSSHLQQRVFIDSVMRRNATELPHNILSLLWVTPEVGVAGGVVPAGVTSPLDSETFPNRVLSNAHIFLIPSTTAGKLGVFSTSDWFVLIKLAGEFRNWPNILFKAVYTPVDALGKHSLKRIHTSTLYDIDKRPRVEDDLYCAVQICQVEFGFVTDHRKIGKDRRGLSTTVNASIILHS